MTQEGKVAWSGLISVIDSNVRTTLSVVCSVTVKSTALLVHYTCLSALCWTLSEELLGLVSVTWGLHWHMSLMHCDLEPHTQPLQSGQTLSPLLIPTYTRLTSEWSANALGEAPAAAVELKVIMNSRLPEEGRTRLPVSLLILEVSLWCPVSV